jgi:methionyl-tRNA formyltransferase
MRIVYFGTPSFSADILEYLLENGVSVEAVITRPDMPQNRSATPIPSAVKSVALKYNLPIYQPEKASQEDFKKILTSFKADLFVVVAFGEILKQHVLEAPPLGCINVHASLLPKFRGAAPVQRAVMQGEKESGVTIMRLSRKMDAGGILLQQAVPIGEEMTSGELMDALCEEGKEALLKVIKILNTSLLEVIEQDIAKVTLAPKISVEECKINFNMPAKEVHNLIRGVSPNPGAWCLVTIHGKEKRLKVYKSNFNYVSKGAPGSVLRQDVEGLWVACSSGAVRLRLLQLEGKREMADTEFIKGISCTFK